VKKVQQYAERLVKEAVKFAAAVEKAKTTGKAEKVLAAAGTYDMKVAEIVGKIAERAHALTIDANEGRYE